ncbi:MAG TPA: PAS domain-containing sensor histidine kinase [Anaerolineae bacterium]
MPKHNPIGANGHKLKRKLSIQSKGKPAKETISQLDLTEHQRAEEALQVSETRYRRLFETAQDGIIILDAATGEITDVNPFLIEMLGYPQDEFIGKHLWEIGPFRDIAASQAAFKELQTRGYIRYEDLPLEKKNGQWMDVEFVSNVYQVDHRHVIQCNIRDITLRKRAEDALRASRDDLEQVVAARTADLESANVQLRMLTQAIVSAQEDERRRVSRELHDEAGQALTALKISLQMMRDELPPAQDSLHQKVDEAIALTNKTVEQIRRLAQDLRPSALESAGLDATLEGLCREYARRTLIQIDYDGAQLPVLPGPMDICLYRFLQEALTNATRHGEATEIQVDLKRDGHKILLTVEDNGRGFDPKAVLFNHARPPGIGLIGMQERLKMVGGWLEIHSEIGRGTRLVAHVDPQRL